MSSKRLDFRAFKSKSVFFRLNINNNSVIICCVSTVYINSNKKCMFFLQLPVFPEIVLWLLNGQSHSKNAWITHKLRTYFHCMHNASVDRTWIVIDCKWMCVESGLCVILSLEQLKKLGVRYSWVGVHSLCVEYAWLCVGHASAVSAYASELVRNRARPHPFNDFHIMHEQRTYLVHSTDIHWLLLTKLAYASTCTLCHLFVSDCKW